VLPHLNDKSVSSSMGKKGERKCTGMVSLRRVKGTGYECHLRQGRVCGRECVIEGKRPGEKSGLWWVVWRENWGGSALLLYTTGARFRLFGKSLGQGLGALVTRLVSQPNKYRNLCSKTKKSRSQVLRPSDEQDKKCDGMFQSEPIYLNFLRIFERVDGVRYMVDASKRR
jgi:hypothetical protein